MSIYQTVISRRTVRDYTSEPVPEELVRRLLQAGRMAPSSSDSQPWHFVVVREPGTIARLGDIATQGHVPCRRAGGDRGLRGGRRAARAPGRGAGHPADGDCRLERGPGHLLRGSATGRATGGGEGAARHPEDVELVSLLPFGYRQEGFKRGAFAARTCPPSPTGSASARRGRAPRVLRRLGRLRQFHIGVSYAPPFRTG